MADGINAPIVPLGFTPYEPAESGLAPGTVRGRISSSEAGEAFGYTHDLLRRFQAAAGSLGVSLHGTWDFQIVESEAPGAKVIFDQSVQVGIVTVSSDDLFSAAAGGAFGGLAGVLSGGIDLGVGLYAYFFENSGQGKFKTRIVNGEAVRNVVEAAGLVPASTAAGAPGQPGEVQFSNLRQEMIHVRMPALPAGAATLSLLVAPSASGPFTVFAGNLAGGQELDVTSAGHASAPEEMWCQVRAVSSSGVFADGNKVRDAWPAFDGSTQTAGYEGWKYVHRFTGAAPSIFAEQGFGLLSQTAAVSTGGFIQALWGSPFYDLFLPPGAIVRETHDYWVAASTVNNRYFYQISYKPTIGAQAAHDYLTGETWLVYGQGGQLHCARSRRRESYHLDYASDPVAYAGPSSVFRILRHGTTLRVALQRANQVAIIESLSSGKAWSNPVNVVDGITIFDVSMSAQGDTLVILGKASGPDPANGLATSDIVRAVLRKTDKGTNAWVLNKKEKVAGPVFELNDSFAADKGAPKQPKVVGAVGQSKPVGATTQVAAGDYSYSVAAVGAQGHSVTKLASTVTVAAGQWVKLLITNADDDTTSFEIYRGPSAGPRQYLTNISADKVAVGGTVEFLDEGQLTPGKFETAATLVRSGAVLFWIGRFLNIVRVWMSTDEGATWKESVT